MELGFRWLMSTSFLGRSGGGVPTSSPFLLGAGVSGGALWMYSLLSDLFAVPLSLPLLLVVRCSPKAATRKEAGESRLKSISFLEMRCWVIST